MRAEQEPMAGFESSPIVCKRPSYNGGVHGSCPLEKWVKSCRVTTQDTDIASFFEPGGAFFRCVKPYLQNLKSKRENVKAKAAQAAESRMRTVLIDRERSFQGRAQGPGAQGLRGSTVLALRVGAGGLSLVGLKSLGVSTSNKFPQTFPPIVNIDFHLCGV